MQRADAPITKNPNLDPPQMLDLDPPGIAYLKKLALVTQTTWQRGESTEGSYGVAKKDLLKMVDEVRLHISQMQRLLDRTYDQCSRLDELGRKIVVDALNGDETIMDNRIREGNTIAAGLALLHTALQLYLPSE